MQTKDEWILEDHLGLQIIRCPKCNQAINCNQYGLYYKEHYKFCPFCGKPMKVPESPITHMPLIPPTDDERWNRELEKMKRVIQIWNKRRVGIEIKKMVHIFFCDSNIWEEEKGVCSDNHEWYMTSGNGDVVGEIYYCKDVITIKSACQIKNTSYGYAVIPACDEMYYVAKYTADVLRDLDFEVKIFDRYYDEPGGNEIEEIENEDYHECRNRGW